MVMVPSTSEMTRRMFGSSSHTVDETACRPCRLECTEKTMVFGLVRVRVRVRVRARARVRVRGRGRGRGRGRARARVRVRAAGRLLRADAARSWLRLG